MRVLGAYCQGKKEWNRRVQIENSNEKQKAEVRISEVSFHSGFGLPSVEDRGAARLPAPGS